MAGKGFDLFKLFKVLKPGKRQPGTPGKTACCGPEWRVGAAAASWQRQAMGMLGSTPAVVPGAAPALAKAGRRILGNRLATLAGWVCQPDSGFQMWCLGLYASSTLRLERSPEMSSLTLRDENRPHPGKRTERKEVGLYLAQPKADCGQTWPSLALSWAEQGFTWAQLG